MSSGNLRPSVACKCRSGAAESFVREGLVVPDHCALCARIAKEGSAVAGAVRDFRAAFVLIR